LRGEQLYQGLTWFHIHLNRPDWVTIFLWSTINVLEILRLADVGNSLMLDLCIFFAVIIALIIGWHTKRVFVNIYMKIFNAVNFIFFFTALIIQLTSSKMFDMFAFETLPFVVLIYLCVIAPIFKLRACYQYVDFTLTEAELQTDEYRARLFAVAQSELRHPGCFDLTPCIDEIKYDLANADLQCPPCNVSITVE